VHHTLVDALVLGVSFCPFRREVRKCARLLLGSKLVATGVQHLLGKVSGSCGGAGVEVKIHGVRVPMAEDLGEIFAHAGAEEGGGSPSAERSSIDEFWWDASAIFAAVGGEAQSRCKLACGNVGPGMLFIGNGWDKAGAQGSIDAVWVHRLLPHVIYERMHSAVEGCAWAQWASNVLLTDASPLAVLFWLSKLNIVMYIAESSKSLQHFLSRGVSRCVG